MSNGERYPEKLVVFGQNAPWGELTGNGESASIPLPKGEREKLQEIVNATRQDAILIVSGRGRPR
jgi:hypothetical protein